MSVRRILLLAVLALTGGCSSMPSLNPIDWFRNAPSGPKPAELPALSSTIPVRTLWQANIGAGGVFVFSPALAEGSVFTAARDGSVTRLNAATGQVMWRVSAGSPLSA